MKKPLVALVLASSLLAGCSSTAPESQEAVIQVQNCGHTLTLDAAPERVVLQDASPVAALASLEVLDRVVAKAGYFPEEYFSEATNAQLAEIPSLSDRLDATGHVEISKEAVMAQDPDVILGYTGAVNPETVSEVPVANDPGFCGEVTNANWSHVDNHVELLAELFGVPERAAAIMDDVAQQVAELNAEAGAGKTVAVVYPGIGGATMYGYGAHSMSNPVVTSVGLTNVFGDEQERVFEISAEQLVAANPDVIVVLHSGEDGVMEAITSLPGADAITAVREDAIMPLSLAFAEPPTPLAVEGAKQLEKFLLERNA